MCWFATYISDLVNFVFKYYIYVLLSNLSCFYCKSSLYFLFTSLFVRNLLCRYVSLVCGLTFNFLNSVFKTGKKLDFWFYQYLILWSVLFISYLTLLCWHRPWNFFFSSNCIILGLHLGYLFLVSILYDMWYNLWYIICIWVFSCSSTIWWIQICYPKMLRSRIP